MIYLIGILTIIGIVLLLSNVVVKLGKENYLASKGWDKQRRALSTWNGFVDCYKKDNMFLDLEAAIKKQKEIDKNALLVA